MRLPRTLTFYVLREISLYAALGGIAVTFLFFGGNAPRYTGDLVAIGFEASDVLLLLRLLSGIIATYVVPIAFLFGVLITMGRMASDREVLALSVCGLGRRSILFPVVALAVGVALLTGYLVNEVEYRARIEMRGLVKSLATRGATPEPGKFLTLGLRVVYVDRRDAAGNLEGVMISDRTDRERPLLIFAETGRFGFDEERNAFEFHLESGEVHVEEPRASREFKRMSFVSLDYWFDVSEMFDVGSAHLRPYDMSNQQINEILQAAESGQSLKHFAKKEPLHYELEIQRRRALPVAPVLFALVAVPLGIRLKRGSRSWGAILCGLLALIYYLALTFGRQMAIEGFISPIVALWSPNVMFAALAAVLLAQRETLE